MKRFFVSFAAAVVAMAFAVSANAQISVGVGYANEIAPNKAVYKGTGKGTMMNGKYNLRGFYVEGSYNWNFYESKSGVLSLQPGLRYYYMTDLQSKLNLKDGDDKANSSERYNDHLLDIPVLIRYAYDFVPGQVKAYAFAGPVFSLGLSASEVERNIITVDGKVQDGSSKSTTNLYTGKKVENTWKDGKWDESETFFDDHLSMFDLKLGVGLGLQVMEKIDVKFGYNIGLLNRQVEPKDGDTKLKTHSNVLWFGVGYNF